MTHLEIMPTGCTCPEEMALSSTGHCIFPVIQFLFPDSPKIFPVLTLREIR